MLNLFNKKSKNNTLSFLSNKVITQSQIFNTDVLELEKKNNELGQTRHYPPLSKE
jgi:hypothetical protein